VGQAWPLQFGSVLTTLPAPSPSGARRRARPLAGRAARRNAVADVGSSATTPRCSREVANGRVCLGKTRIVSSSSALATSRLRPYRSFPIGPAPDQTMVARSGVSRNVRDQKDASRQTERLSTSFHMSVQLRIRGEISHVLAPREGERSPADSATES
jgi:hypothetical protein